MTDFPWTEQTESELKRLHAEGMSFRQIGEALEIKFGFPCSRNAAIGKALRMKLAKRAPVGNPNPKPRGPRRVLGPSVRTPEGARLREDRRRTMRLTNHGNRFDYVEVNAPDPIPDIADDQIPQEQRKQLFDLENCHCRWPIGDVGTSSFFFCGHPSADFKRGVPYCPMHANRAGAGYGSPTLRRAFRDAA